MSHFSEQTEGPDFLPPKKVIVVGAGPAGCATALFFARRGHRVVLLERARAADIAGAGRTIQLLISPRGRRALAALGLEQAFLQIAVELDARVFHGPRGELFAQQYPKPDWRLHAVGRSDLTSMMWRAVAAEPAVDFRTEVTCVNVRRREREVNFRHPNGEIESLRADLIIGADGAASAVRAALVSNPELRFSKLTDPHRYQEWTLNPPFTRDFPPAHAAHIWARSRWFLVAFPAANGTFRGTFVTSWDTWSSLLESGTLLQALQEDFADIEPYLTESFASKIDSALLPIPVVRCESWSDGHGVLVLGDAAHATAPFLGQGVNLALEDALSLEAELERGGCLNEILRRFEQARVPEGLACCDLSTRAAYQLMKPPPQTATQVPLLLRLNFLGERYQDVARELIPGWNPEIEVRPALRPRRVRFDLPLEYSHRVEFSAGTYLTEEGEPADALYWVESGQVVIEAKEQKLFVSAPVLLGEQGWILRNRCASVRAETDCVASRISFHDVERFLVREPEAGLAFTRALAHLALERMRRGFGEHSQYTVLCSTPGQETAFLQWALEFREHLMGLAIAARPDDARVLRDEAFLPVALELTEAPETWPLSLERLRVGGQLASIVVAGEAEQNSLREALSVATSHFVQTFNAFRQRPEAGA